MSPEASIVVVSYEMAREIPRTLLSLSAPYQLNCPRGRVEVILVDNGSREPPRPEQFAGLDLDLTVHHLPKVSPSPVAALNLGIAEARAPLICAWIDGARMASPGLVDACIRASKRHPRPVIATANYQLGPGPQYVTMLHGYDAAEEDRLIESIGWPADGYRLFEIAAPIQFADDRKPMMESNALFLPRALWDELGGFDPAFASPGGGPCNPDVFIRACAAPDTRLIRIRGEATFHQIHGGVSINAAERVNAVLKALSSEYYRIRGRPMSPVRDLGWVFDPKTGSLERLEPGP
ncbi:MAG TPA: glycosyltransferase family A protein [Caulobacteraceae bacterium]